MTPMHMKIGTQPLGHYFVVGTIRVNEIKVGDKIKFREQAHRSRWQHGIVAGWCGDTVPMIELF